MLLCVSFGLTNQVWNYLEYCLCKTYFVCKILKGECLKILNLEKLGLKLVFWKNISSHTYAFYFLYSMLWGVFSKIRFYFFKNAVFQIFDWSNLFFDQLKFLLKFCVSFCLFRSIEIDFWSIETRESNFLKTQFWLVQTSFSKLFSLSPTRARLHRDFFVVFLQISCKVSLSLSRYVYFTLPFALFFSISCIFSWFLGNFQTMLKLGFFMNLALFCEIDQWVLLLYCYIHDLCWKIWSIWRFVKNQNF